MSTETLATNEQPRTTRSPVRVGLVGSGQWARQFHAPMLAQGPHTALVGVWARHRDRAAEVAAEHQAAAFDSFAELLDSCDAVAFAVPPGVQAVLARQAAQAGRHVMLEKPIAADLASAERLALAILRAGVLSQVVLTWRYLDQTHRFISRVHSARPVGTRAHFVIGSGTAGPFATPWRHELGALHDLGPHVLDLLDALHGPITRLRAHGDPLRSVGMLIDHQDGQTSQAIVSIMAPTDPILAGADVFTRDGTLSLDLANASKRPPWTEITTSFAEAIQGQPNSLDVSRGLYLQRLIDRAVHDCRRGRRIHHSPRTLGQ